MLTLISTFTEKVKLSMGGTKEAIELAYQEQLRLIEQQHQNQLGKRLPLIAIPHRFNIIQESP